MAKKMQCPKCGGAVQDSGDPDEYTVDCTRCGLEGIDPADAELAYYEALGDDWDDNDHPLNPPMGS